MPNATAIIGRIAIKVLPDTSEFRREAQAELDAIEKRLELKVKVKPDLNNLQSKLKAARTKAQESLSDLKLRVDLDDQGSVARGIERIKAELARLREVEIDVSLNEEALHAKLAELRARLDEIRTIDLKINPKNTASLERALQRVEAEIEKLSELNVKVKADRSSLERTAAELRRRLDEAAHVQLELDRKKSQDFLDTVDRMLGDLDITLHPGVDRREFTKVKRQIEAEIEKLVDLQASIKPEMDPRAKRKAEREIKDLQDKIDNLKATIEPNVGEVQKRVAQFELGILARDRIVKLIPEVSATAAAKAATILAALSGARLLGNVFEDLFNGFKNIDKALPKIAALVAGITNLAAWGLTAASNIFALGQGLAEIGPAALALPGILGGIAAGLTVTVIAFKDINKIVPEVKTAWTSIKKTISDNFWDRAARPIRNMVDGLLPQFTAGFASASSSIGAYFGNLARNLRTSFDGPVHQMFLNLAQSVDINGKATGALANIITKLGTLGSSYLPRLAGWFATLQKRFSGFLDKAAKNGDLQKWVDTGIERMKELGAVFKNFFGILGGLSKGASAAGGSTLKNLADTLGKVRDVVNSPGFQDGLVRTLQSAHQAMHLLAANSGPQVKAMFSELSKIAQTALPAMGAALGRLAGAFAGLFSNQKFADAIRRIFDSLALAIDAVAPAIGRLAPVFADVFDLIGTMATQFAPLLAAAFDAIGPVISQIAKALGPVVKIFSEVLLDAIKELAPIIGQLAVQFIKLVGPLVKQLEPAFRAIIPTIAEMAKLIGGVLVKIMPVVGKAIATLLPPLAKIAEALLAILVECIKPLLPLVPVLADLIAALAEAFAPVLKVIADVLKLIMPVLVPALSFLAKLIGNLIITRIQGLVQVFLGAFKAISGIVKFFDDLVHGRWQKLWGDLKQIVAGVWQAILGAIKSALAPIIAIVKTIWDGIKGPFQSGVATIKTVWHDCWEAVKTVFSAVGSFFKTVWDSSIGWVFGKVKDGVRAVRDVFKDVVAGIKGVFQGLGDGLKAVYDHTIGPIIKTIKTAISTVVDSVKDLADAIASLPGAGLGIKIKNPKNVFDTGNGPIVGGTGPRPPRLADGATILPRAGGTLAVLAEAGRAESVVDTGKVNRLIDQALSGGDTNAAADERHFHYHAATNHSLPEEDVFSATQRVRFAW